MMIQITSGTLLLFDNSPFYYLALEDFDISAMAREYGIYKDGELDDQFPRFLEECGIIGKLDALAIH